MNGKKEILLIVVALVIFTPLFLLAVFLSPEEVKAISIFTPFGGKVIAWIPEAPGCLPLTTAVSIATLGTINITVEELKVGPPLSGTFGVLRVDGATIPFITDIYSNYNYMTPGVWVIGNTIDVCDICDKIDDFPFVKKICELPAIEEILNVGCDIVGTTCPITKLVHKIGSSLVPSL